MNLTQLERDFCKRFGQYACTAQSFTTTNAHYVGYNPLVVDRTLASLVDKGVIHEVKSSYKLTQKGRNLLDGPGQLVEVAKITNASSRIEYVPAAWQSVRPGADDHLSKKSRGLPV